MLDDQQSAKGAKDSLASSMNMKEQALSALLLSLAKLAVGCYSLHENGALNEDRRSAFYNLGVQATTCQHRFDDLWVRIVNSDVITLDDLVRLNKVCITAARSLDSANADPSTDNLLTAYAQTGSVLDLVSKMLDHA